MSKLFALFGSEIKNDMDSYYIDEDKCNLGPRVELCPASSVEVIIKERLVVDKDHFNDFELVFLYSNN